ncbi:MAG: ATP-binding cassette domain-containing protein [Deltaproteobacteria bacterium]|nr:ATP-binding cassette domain-containing protein [Deltaproteobacteria bacterium]
MISIQNVSKEFGPVRAVDDISFKINHGEVVGFLGPNGAGKSTTMRMITGFILPTHGKINISGIDVIADPVAAQKKTGYLPESVALYPDMVVLDLLLFLGKMRGLKKATLDERLKYVIRQCGLKSALDRKIGTLSKGYKQRVGLAQALLHDPDVLILDEPTVGLDPNQIIEIRALIKEIGINKTILLSTHILSEVSATCQRVLIINRGRIVAEGSPQSLINEQKNESTYHVSVRGDLKIMPSVLKDLPGFAALDICGSDGDLHQLKIYCSGQDDLSEQIFDLAVLNKWRLSRLGREQQTLESVFKNLTE